MSQISDALAGMYSEQAVTNRIFTGKRAMQLAFVAVMQANATVQALVDEGSFAGVDATLMSALSAAWNALKTCHTTMLAENIQEALNWQPTE